MIIGIVSECNSSYSMTLREDFNSAMNRYDLKPTIPPTNSKEPCLPYYLPILEKEIVRFINF